MHQIFQYSIYSVSCTEFYYLHHADSLHSKYILFISHKRYKKRVGFFARVLLNIDHIIRYRFFKITRKCGGGRMSIKKLEEQIGGLTKNVKALKTIRQSIVDHMRPHGIHLAEGISKAHIEILSNDPELVSGYISLSSAYILDGEKIANLVDSYIKDYTNYREIEQANIADQRAADRKYYWVLFFERLGRWGLGTVAAVLLYSLAVYASSQIDFIKVPIKDWLPQQTQQQ